MNTMHKLQRLHALRIQAAQIDAEIKRLTVETNAEIACFTIAANGTVRKRYKGKFIDVTPSPAKHEQDLASWARRLADVGDL